MNKLCERPFNELWMENNNQIKLCGRIDDTYGTEQLDNIYSVGNLFYLPSFVKIRKDFINGIIPDACKKCFDLEKRHKLLRRKITVNTERIINEFVEYESKPGILIIRNFSTCNLQCKMCRPVCSTSLLNIYTEEMSSLTGYEIKNIHSLNKFNQNVLYNLKDSLRSHINDFTLNFIGGEPFIDPNVLDILDMLDQKTKHKVILTTNLTFEFTDRIERILDNINRLKGIIVWSCDGPPEIHKYIRNCNIKKIEENIKYITTTYPEITWHINSVIQALNAGHINDLFKYTSSILSDKSMNICMDNTEAREGITTLFSLHKEILNEYRERLVRHTYKIPQNYYDSILHSFNVAIENYDEKKWMDFCRYINCFDKIQKNNVLHVYPEFKKFWIDS